VAKPKVLFLCTGNSARSQMAEGYLRHVAGDTYEPLSAGISPKGLNPLAVEAIDEIGINIAAQRSKDVRDFSGMTPEYVVTVCDNAKEQCPVFPGTFRSLHWSLQDPAEATGSREEKLAVFRRIRDEIIRHIIREFVEGSSVQSAARP
jgi:arsenate reductase